MARKWQIEMWETLSVILGGCDAREGDAEDDKLSDEIKIAEGGTACGLKTPPRRTTA